MSAFEYQLSRSLRRRSLSIVVRRGEVKVFAPVFVPQRQVERFVNSKSQWVVEKLNEQRQWLDEQALAQKRYVSGEVFGYLGQQLKLDVVGGSKAEVAIDGDRLVVVVPSRVKSATRADYIKKKLNDWYKQQLEQFVADRIECYSRQMGLWPKEVKVRNYTRRWGSCSAKGVVSFNLLLMMAPSWVIDYVVVHELAHLQHMNHSEHFWALVRAYYPNIKPAKQYLADNAAQLTL